MKPTTFSPIPSSCFPTFNIEQKIEPNTHLSCSSKLSFLLLQTTHKHKIETTSTTFLSLSLQQSLSPSTKKNTHTHTHNTFPNKHKSRDRPPYWKKQKHAHFFWPKNMKREKVLLVEMLQPLCTCWKNTTWAWKYLKLLQEHTKCFLPKKHEKTLLLLNIVTLRHSC